MRPVILTVILVLVIGIAGSLLLEYNNRRFVESLDKPEISNAEVVEDEKDVTSSIEPVTFQSDPLSEVPHIERNAEVELTQQDGQTDEDTEVITEPLPSVSEQIPSETPMLSDTHTHADDEVSQLEDGTRKESPEKARARTVLEDLRKRPPDMLIPIEEILKDPNMKFSGTPEKHARLYILSPNEKAEILEASRILEE